MATSPTFIREKQLYSHLLIPESDDECNYAPAKAAVRSAGELVRRIREREDDLGDMGDQDEKIVDCWRYIVTICSKGAAVAV